jgi:hypothetical protein
VGNPHSKISFSDSLNSPIIHPLGDSLCRSGKKCNT